MSSINSIGGSTGSTPSIQPQTQAQASVNPGLSANQISLAAPPASFSQGKRFFLTETNGGNYQLTTVSTDPQNNGAPLNANPAISADALEVNASIAYAITTGQINATSYMAEQNAKQLRLNDVMKQVGSSPLQTPSLAGEITGDRFDASSILQFLKKNKSQLDDSNANVEASARGQDLVSLTVLGNLKEYIATFDSNTAQATTLRAQINTLQAQSRPDQAAIAAATAQLNVVTTAATAAQNGAQELAQKLFAHGSQSGINSIRKDLEKLNKDQLAKLSEMVSSTVTQAISKQIDDALLADSPIANPSSASLLNTADGTVIKTAQQQAKEALVAQLDSQQFRQELAQTIIDHAQTLGIDNLPSADLNGVAIAFAALTSESLIGDSTLIDEAISDSETLLADVTYIVELALQGQANRGDLPRHV